MGGDHGEGQGQASELLRPFTHTEACARYLRNLKAAGFEGEIEAGIDTRLVFSTDNSVYQRIPLAVIFPKNGDDLPRAVKAASDGALTLAVRGGGTGTNGQSLTPDIVVDVSRNMTEITAFDAESQTITVEPGVILSRLNAFLKPHGLFFPPTVSTATRATIGGMVGTDASGKGSRIYGKTSDYITAMDVILFNGADLTVTTLSPEELSEHLARPDLTGEITREVHRVVQEQRDEIARIFPDMNRGLTGYNLQNILTDDGSFSLLRLLAGSEGTLALTKSITLRLRPIPKERSLLVIRYRSFDATLNHVSSLLDAEPLAVEVLDDRVLDAARQDVTWSALEGVLGRESSVPVEGLSFVEFTGDDPAAIEISLHKAIEFCDRFGSDIIDYKIVSDQSIIAQLWTLREKSVGLLGRPDGWKQGVAFVEDTAVPPQNLAEYVRDFRAVLDRHNLQYGMFGHADVGCLHVRPFLNMLTGQDRDLIRTISDEVAALTRRYGGLLWGEHGRGFRGEFSPFFFGETLFQELCRIKKAFDPKDIFNRGKLVPGEDHPVDRIDGVPFKGGYDSEIAAPLKAAYAGSVTCNGNGACFNREPEMAMCPSYKATGDRRHSPKGRATLLRSWLRLHSLPAGSPERSLLTELTLRAKDALDGCLSCKACASQCPIKVDIPAMRATFMEAFYKENRRPLRDWLIYSLEPLLTLARAMPGLANLAMQNPLARVVLKRLGLVDLPTIKSARLPRGAAVTKAWLSGAGAGKIAILQDSYTGSFDGPLVEETYRCLRALGYDVRVTQVLDNGKARHVRGFIRAFAKDSDKITRYVAELVRHGVTVLSIDAATGLMFGHEYAAFGTSVAVIPLEQFLRSEIAAGRVGALAASGTAPDFSIVAHCTEQALLPSSLSDWSLILKHFGIQSGVKKTGCCGMAGLFGHQAEQQKTSRALFHENWSHLLKKPVLATGFSCRCQAERLAGERPRHPIEAISSQLRAAGLT